MLQLLLLACTGSSTHDTGTDTGNDTGADTAADTDTAETGNTDTAEGNHTPTVTVSLSPDEPNTDELLVATAIGADEDFDTALAYHFTWRVNGVDQGWDNPYLDGATAFSAGDVIEVEVVATDGLATSAPATASTNATGCWALDWTSGGYVQVPADAGFLYGSDYTMEAWSKPAAGDNYRRLVDHEGTSTDGVRFEVVGDARINFNLDDSSSGEAFGDFAMDTWHHVAGVVQGSTLSLYVDGVLVDSGDARSVGDMGEQDLFIGASDAGGRFGWSGLIGPVRISSTPRYAADFTPEWGWTPDASTLAMYAFSEGNGLTVGDSSGAGHDGAILGPTWTDFPCP